MNRFITALQRLCVAVAVVGGLWVLLGESAGLPPAQGAGHTARPRAHAHASIVDGSLATIAEFPFQVALYDPRLGPPAKGFFCGGVIIGASRVATAAHCLIGERGRRSAPDEIEVLAGSSALEPTDPGSVRDPVTSAEIDSAYKANSSDYDVGLVQLAHPLWPGAAPPLDGHSAIAPLTPDVALANARVAAGFSGQVPAAAQVVVSGWGDLNAEPGAAPAYPLRLHQANVPLVSTGLCEEAYGTIEQAITPRMLCAGSRTDSCYGDSGGPLVARGPGGGPAGDTLLGLVDFGNGCGQAGYPGVYVRIADPAVATFLGAGTARSSTVHTQRSACLRHSRVGRHSRGGSRSRAGMDLRAGSHSPAHSHPRAGTQGHLRKRPRRACARAGLCRSPRARRGRAGRCRRH